MRQHSVLLLSSHHCNWVGLRTILREKRGLHIAAEVKRVDEVMPAITRLRPDVIFTPVKLHGASVLPLIEQIRACWPAIKVIVLADEPDRDEMVTLAQVGIDGCLLWTSLSPLVLHHCLAIVLETDLQVSSRAARRTIASTRPRHNGIVLTAREQAVLKGLTEGLTQREIAVQAHLSERTVRRVIDILEEKLDAPSLFALGLKATQHGLAS
jgi:DNA-binding NarL/FixJ family response regulator